MYRIPEKELVIKWYDAYLVAEIPIENKTQQEQNKDNTRNNKHLEKHLEKNKQLSITLSF